MKHIVLITSGQPSLNPRLVKEADALIEAGYQVTVIYQYWNEWGTEMDVNLLINKKWKAIKAGGDPHFNRFKFWKSRIFHKAITKLIKVFGLGNNFAEIALNRSLLYLYEAAVQIPGSMYVAHNLGALPAAIWAAKKNNSKCGFDAEDFHRFEVTDDADNLDVKLKRYVEDKYIPELNYLTTASPLITEAYQQLYPDQHPTTILNVFPKQKIIKKSRDNDALKLFWFSQTIGKNRGLEEVIRSIGRQKDSMIELHLLGNYNDSIQHYFGQIAKQSGITKKVIFYYAPIPADDIYTFASQFDIGLATEIREPKNRDICLTNKIFTYIQSGLAIVASNTSAQQRLMSTYPNMGLIYDLSSPETLDEAFNLYATDDSILGLHQENAAHYAFETLNWEKEKRIFLSIIKQHCN